MLSRLKRTVGSELFRNSVLALSFSLALASFIVAYIQGRKAQSLQYLLNASQHAPILEPVQQPQILALGATLDFDPETQAVTITLDSLSTELSLENKTGILATLDTWISVDAYTRDAILRKQLLGEISGLPMALITDDEFWDGERQVAQGEETTLRFETTLRGLNSSSFVVHYLVAYRNPAGLLYDTYYWVMYTAEPSPCSAACSQDNPLFSITDPRWGKTVCFYLRVERTTIDKHVYTSRETASFSNLMERFVSARSHGFEVWHTLTGPFRPDEEIDDASRE